MFAGLMSRSKAMVVFSFSSAALLERLRPTRHTLFSADSQSQDEARIKSLQGQDRAQNLRMPSHDIHGQGLRKLPSMLRVDKKSMLLQLRLQICRAAPYSLSTGVSTIIRDALLSALCEISMDTSQSG
jgi:hypothetical protein